MKKLPDQIKGVIITKSGDVVSRFYRNEGAAKKQNPAYGVIESSPRTIWRADFLPYNTPGKWVNETI